MSRGKVAILVACVCLVPANPASCPVRGPLWQHTWARQVARGLSHAHVNPLMRAWAAPPTCMSRGLRAYQGVYAHTQGLTCERAMWLSGRYHPGQAPDNVREQPIPPGTAQNAGYFATSGPFSVFFAEVVCGLGAPALQTASAPPPVGGNCTTRGSDTSATRRKRASCSAKPPPATGLENASGTESPAAVPVGAKKFAQHGPSGGSSAKKFAQHA